jgi:hypothetical protein
VKRKGIGAAFSDEDLELMSSLWLEEGKRATGAADRPTPSKRAARPRAVSLPPDRRSVSEKKKTGNDGPGPASKA